MENPNCKGCWYYRDSLWSRKGGHGGIMFCHFSLYENFFRPYKWLECPGYKERITKNESSISKPGN